MTVNVTDTVGANNTIVLDSSSKIPAIDGSQVTALSASAFTTGSLATARIDVGTTAGKVLQLDGSARIPALSGVNLTGVAGPTSSTSDPTISTNPTLGAKWINKTSGSVYICTDATAGANVWTNVGRGWGNIHSYVFQGSNYGYCMGGWGTPNVINNIQRFAFASNVTAFDVGDIAAHNSFTAAGLPNNPSHGYAMSGGGYSGGVFAFTTNIVKLSFASNTQDTVGVTGVMSNGSAGHYLNVCGASNGIHGYGHGGYGIAGGDTPANRILCRKINKFNYASEVDSTVSGSQVGTHPRGYTAGASSATYGYTLGGVDLAGGAGVSDTIQKFSMTSDADATDIANLTATVRNVSGASSTTHAYAMGGYNNSALQNMVNKFSFSSEANATDIGDLTVSGHCQTGSSSTTHGFNVGGARTAASNIIDKIAFATDGNLTDHGDLQVANYNAAAVHY